MTTNPSYPEAGRGSAMAVYVLYLLSIPSFAVFALVGVILALVSRDGAGPLARSHLNHQINIWMTAFVWAIVLAILGAIGTVLTVVLVGFPILAIVWVIGIIVFVWFTVKALLGLLALLDGRPR